MEIKEIVLTNFRNHFSTKLTGLGKIVYFLGANGAGKSSLVDAIQYAATGCCRGVDEAGRGSDSLKCAIPGGPKAAASVLLKTSRGEVIRGVGQGPKSAAHSAIRQTLGLDERVLKIVAAPPNLLRLERKKQEEVFFSLTGGGVDIGVIERALIDAGILPPEAAEIAGQIGSPQQRELYLSHLKAKRPEIKREIAGLVYVPREGLPKMDEAKRKLLEAEYASLNADTLRQKGAAETSSAERRHLSEQVERIEAKIRGIEEAHVVDDRMTPAEVDGHAKKIADYEAAKAESDKAMTARNLALQDMGQARQRGERVKTLGAKCGVCNQAIAEAFVKEQLEEQRKAYAEFKAAADKAESAFAAAGERMKAVDVQGVRERLSRHERATWQAQNDEKTLLEAKGELELTRRRLNALAPAQAVDTSAAEKRLGELKAKIEGLRDAEAEHAQLLRVNGQRQQFEDELATVEKLIEAVGPGGPVAALMTQGGVADVIEAVRKNGERLGVGDISIQSAPWGILLNGRPIELASASEEWRVAAAFGVAIAARAGASFVCLDGAEILRGENRDRFQEIVMASGLEQVFVAGAVDEIPESLEPIEGVTVFSVTADERGVSQVKRIGAAVAA